MANVWSATLLQAKSEDDGLATIGLESLARLFLASKIGLAIPEQACIMLASRDLYEDLVRRIRSSWNGTGDG